MQTSEPWLVVTVIVWPVLTIGVSTSTPCGCGIVAASLGGRCGCFELFTGASPGAFAGGERFLTWPVGAAPSRWSCGTSSFALGCRRPIVTDLSPVDFRASPGVRAGLDWAAVGANPSSHSCLEARTVQSVHPRES